MGLLGRLFGKPTGREISVKKPNVFDSPISEPLKTATQKKKDGDLDGAIKELEFVYKYMNDHPTWYSAQNACRLPLYLAEAKRNDEAWTLLGEIFKKSNRCDYDYVLSKMKLFLQRSGRSLEAVKYGVMAHTARMCDLKRLLADGVEVFTSPMEKEEIEKLLKKAKRPELVDAVYFIAKKHYAKTPTLDLGGISRDMNDTFRSNQST